MTDINNKTNKTLVLKLFEEGGDLNGEIILRQGKSVRISDRLKNIDVVGLI